VLTSFTIPANTLSVGDLVRCTAVLSKTAGVTNINNAWGFGATNVSHGATFGASDVLHRSVFEVYVSGTNSQNAAVHSERMATFGNSAAATLAESINGPITVSFQAWLASAAGDTAILRMFSCEVIRAR
jgi:hypothetical protein